MNLDEQAEQIEQIKQHPELTTLEKIRAMRRVLGIDGPAPFPDTVAGRLINALKARREAQGLFRVEDVRLDEVDESSPLAN